MSQNQEATNKAVVQRMFDEVVNLGKLELVDELFDPEFHSESPNGVLDRDGFGAYVEAWRSGFSGLSCEVSNVVAEGDRIAWQVKATGVQTGDFNGIPASGRAVDFDSLNIATFRDGRCLEHKVVMDTLTLMIQLGVVEPPQ